MVTTETGRAAESAVASKLRNQGFKILAQNWRRPRCEIDIVAQKDGIVYFVEVKFRASAGQGDGFEHITNQKQKQMRYAAEIWCAENGFDGDRRLMAAAVSGLEHNIELLEL